MFYLFFYFAFLASLREINDKVAQSRQVRKEEKQAIISLLLLINDLSIFPPCRRAG